MLIVGIEPMIDSESDAIPLHHCVPNSNALATYVDLAVK